MTIRPGIYSHTSPTIFTGCELRPEALPIFGGRTRVVVFRFQKSTKRAASLSGLSCKCTREVSIPVSVRADITRLMQVVTDIREHFELEFTLPEGRLSTQ